MAEQKITTLNLFATGPNLWPDLAKTGKNFSKIRVKTIISWKWESIYHSIGKYFVVFSAMSNNSHEYILLTGLSNGKVQPMERRIFISKPK